jgi:hypothetical protein
MEEGDLIFISKMINVLKESESKLESFYKLKDAKNFNATKKFMLQVQKEIDQELQ